MNWVIKIVSFWTSKPYHEAALVLEASLHGEYYEISKVEASTWQEAVVRKPQYIFDQLENSGQIQGVLWTDADSKLCRKPDWSVFESQDMACVEWTRPGTVEPEFLTGTMYWAKTPMGIKLCREWAFETPKYRQHFTPEQAALKEVLSREEFKEAKVKKLPVEWCWIFDDFKDMYPDKSPTIEHYQLSRTQRNAVQPG